MPIAFFNTENLIMFINSVVDFVLAMSSWAYSKNVAGFKSLYSIYTELFILDA